MNNFSVNLKIQILLDTWHAPSLDTWLQLFGVVGLPTSLVFRHHVTTMFWHSHIYRWCSYVRDTLACVCVSLTLGILFDFFVSVDIQNWISHGAVALAICGKHSNCTLHYDMAAWTTYIAGYVSLFIRVLRCTPLPTRVDHETPACLPPEGFPEDGPPCGGGHWSYVDVQDLQTTSQSGRHIECGKLMLCFRWCSKEHFIWHRWHETGQERQSWLNTVCFLVYRNYGFRGASSIGKAFWTVP